MIKNEAKIIVEFEDKPSKIRCCLFVRVSTDQQDYDRQVNELTIYAYKKGWDVVEVIASKQSGAKKFEKREDIKKLFRLAEEEKIDKVVVSEISRLGRVAKYIRKTLEYLHEHKVSVCFQNLGGLESIDEKGKETFVTNIIIAIYSELAQEERRILSERVKSGMAEAKRKGKQIGRKKGHTKSDLDYLDEYSDVIKCLKEEMSLRKTQEHCEVSRNTVIKVKKWMISKGMLTPDK